MSYGGHNETIGPYWVAIDRGFYQKHGIDGRLLQVRNAQISLTALVSGEVPVFLPSVGNVLSGVSAGAKIGCVAFPIKGISRELMVRKEIDSLAALRGYFYQRFRSRESALRWLCGDVAGLAA